MTDFHVARLDHDAGGRITGVLGFDASDASGFARRHRAAERLAERVG